MAQIKITFIERKSDDFLGKVAGALLSLTEVVTIEKVGDKVLLCTLAPFSTKDDVALTQALNLVQSKAQCDIELV